MIGESQADARIAPIYTKYKDVDTTILAHTGDITLNLICSKGDQETAQARVDELAGKIEEELEEFIYSSQAESLEQIVLYYLGMHAATLAVAESCTGGLGRAAPDQHQRQFAIVSGRSGGLQRPAQDSLRRCSSVADRSPRRGQQGSRRSLWRKEFARRHPRPLAWASPASPVPAAARKKSRSAWFTSLSTDGKQTDVVERRFGGDREHIRAWTSQQALDLVRRRLK